MRHMKLKVTAKQKKPIGKKARKESGQTLHELLIASSILAITLSGFTSGIIRSKKITHQSSINKMAESIMSNDLESIVKRRFYTFRCRQGPCQAATSENDKSLMYYDLEDSDDKQDFISQCNARGLARDLLSEDVNDVTTGEQTINSSALTNQEITITRTISLDESNRNQAVVEYEAERDSKVIASLKSILVPNAVHWCN